MTGWSEEKNKARMADVAWPVAPAPSVQEPYLIPAFGQERSGEQISRIVCKDLLNAIQLPQVM